LYNIIKNAFTSKLLFYPHHVFLTFYLEQLRNYITVTATQTSIHSIHVLLSFVVGEWELLWCFHFVWMPVWTCV